VSQLWNRHATAAALHEGDDRPDNVTRLILKSIALHGPVRSSDAARDLGLSRASISRRVSWLEAEGLIDAAPDPDDGRASLLTLTELGEQRLQSLSKMGADAMREIVEDFSDHELETLARLLARFNSKANTRLTDTIRKRNA
jgi:DNA-binding MarR family transcriptional regulator